MKRGATVLLVLAVVSLVMCSVGTAALISATDPNLNGVSFYAFSDGTRIQSEPRAMEVKTINGWTGLGVSGGYVDGEVDLMNFERIQITYTNPVVLDYITLGFLFPSGQNGDLVNEKAGIRFTYIDGTEVEKEFEFLTANGAAAYNWTGDGSVTNLDLAMEPFAGVWRIDNPFASPIIGIKFFAMEQAWASGAANSDFSIIEVAHVIPVPEPGMMLFFGSGLVGVAVWGRKKYRKQ